MSDLTIFTASDLDRKRRAVLDAAKSGVARVRDTDGSHLVMERAQAFEARSAVAVWSLRLHRLDQAAELPREERRPRHFGDVTWARHLPEEDFQQLRADLWDAVQAAHSELNADIIASAARDWMMRAQARERGARLREIATYGAAKAREHDKEPGDGAEAVRAARRRRARVTS
jgi:hypothetical protein